MKRGIVLIAIVAIIISTQALPATPDKLKSQARVMNTLGSLPVYFIENQGQLDEEVAYYVKGSDKDLYFTADGITIVLNSQEGDEVKRWAVKLEFVDANPDVKPVGHDRQKAVFNYFKGKPEDWQTGIPTYSKLVYEDLWPGIDLVYSGTVNRLKYEFIVKKGSDPTRIRLAYRGVSNLIVEESGALKIATPASDLEDGAPYAYQTIDGRQNEVTVAYAMMEKNNDESFTYGFSVGDYDMNEPLILDPDMLIYCGYIGGRQEDEGWGIDVDKSGNAYIAGQTNATISNFPSAIGPDFTQNLDNDVFVAKVNAPGTGLIYCGYIGGIADDVARDITVDEKGNVYVTGSTESPESSFPLKGGPDLSSNGLKDAFVAKVNPQGTDLVYCGYIGGEDDDNGFGVAVDHLGNAYVVGTTDSDESTFPVKKGPDLTHNGSHDVYVAKVASDGRYLEFCGYIGGDSTDYGNAIAVNDKGVYIAGHTRSDESTFPVVRGPYLTHKNPGAYDNDGFVAHINLLGTDVVYCGYIGGWETDVCTGIAADSEGNAYVVGYTRSKPPGFPVIVGPDLTFNSSNSYKSDAFVAKVTSKGEDLAYCGYIGGKDQDFGYAIAVDPEGNAYITGNTHSDEESFPVKVGPGLIYMQHLDAFLTRVNASGGWLDYSGYIGGSLSEYAMDIALDDEGNTYITGFTYSDEESFPVKVGPDLSFNGGLLDAFVAMVGYMTLETDQAFLSASVGGSILFSLNAGQENGNRQYLVLGSATGIDPGFLLPGGINTLPLTWDLFTDTVLLFANTTVFSDFLGNLDGNGQASSQLNSGSLPPSYAGLKIYFAYCLNAPFDFASNPVEIEIVP